MNLCDFFDQSASRYGTRLAIEMRPRYRTLRWTYAHLHEQTARMAQRLADEGIQKGDRVLLFSANSPLWIAGFFAILQRGAIVVPLNPQSTAEQLDRIIASSEPKLLLKSSRLPWIAGEIKTVELQSVMEETNAKPAAMPTRPDIKGSDLAEIVYTSGTTGEPKGVMLTHANLLSNLASLSQSIPMEPTDHLVSIIPLFHMYGQMTSMLYPLKHGAAVTYLPSLGSKLILETFRYTPTTHLTAVPEFLKTIMDRLEQRLEKEQHLKGILRIPFIQHLPLAVRKVIFAPIRKRISPTLHTISSGGAPLEPELEKKWRTLGFTVLQGYGLTETSPIIASNTYEYARVGTVGKPAPGVQIKISKDGELLVKGPNVMVGYYKDEKRTKAVFDEDGWFKTDDGAKIDEDGFLSIFGRKKYMIVGAGGEKVFPEDIEEELNKHASVKDSAVVGVKKNGRVVIHAVILSANGDVAKAVEEANAHLASHQQILAWSVWPEADFPRSATRKVKKEEIITWIANQADHVAPVRHDEISPFMRLLAQVTKRDPRSITKKTKIVADLKLDSLLRIELVSQIEEEFGVDVEEKSITAQTTVEELERAVLSTRGTPPRIVEFPRWSARWLFCQIRPAVQSALLFWWMRFYFKVRVEGEENFTKAEGPFLFMPNHVSYIDPAALLPALAPRIRKNLGIAAAVDVLYTRFKLFAPLADLVFNSYPFPTEANENIKPGLEYTGRLLDAGFNVMIFPEGQVNRKPKQQHMNHLKAGAGVIACEMDATVIPMAIVGLGALITPGQLLPHARGEVIVRFGKPLKFHYTDSYAATTAKLEKAMSKLLLASTKQ